MVVKKRKTGKMEMYAPHVDEIESFTLLNLSNEEYKLFLHASDHWENKGDVMSVAFIHNDDLDKLFNAVAVKHAKNNPDFFDVTKKYISDIPGTSLLIRDPIKHTIRVAFRKTTKMCTINILFITNENRERFFAACKQGIYFKETNKYMLDSRDESYKVWSTFMNDSFVKAVSK